MIEAVWYGLTAALTFIGFISLVCFAVLHLYKPKGNGRYIITVNEKTSRHETERLVYGAHVRNLIFGDLICERTTVVFDGYDIEKYQATADFAAQYGINCIAGKEKDGSGAC